MKVASNVTILPEGMPTDMIMFSSINLGNNFVNDQINSYMQNTHANVNPYFQQRMMDHVTVLNDANMMYRAEHLRARIANVYTGSDITILSSSASFVGANHVMQQFIMCDPEIIDLQSQHRLHGWREDLVDYTPDAARINYRRSISGITQIQKTYHNNMYSEDNQDKLAFNSKLTFSEKATIRAAQNALRSMLDETDPTNPWE
jgi:hypothetical protein